MGDKIECNYEEMTNIMRLFNSEAESMNQLFTQTRQKVEGLHGVGWIGRGSEAFFAEMQGVILPSMGRLVKALHDGAQATKRINETFQAAEEEGKSIFKAQ